MYNFLYRTGLRLGGECIALIWNDINLEEKTLRVCKSFANRLGISGYNILDPKTENSVRTIDLDDDLIILLKKHYEEESKIYQFDRQIFLFGNVKPISPTTFARHLDGDIKKAGVKRITPHGFRHSHVSLLIHLRCDSRDVAERIGDTVEVVESTYYHMFPKKKAQTVCALNNLISKNKG